MICMRCTVDFHKTNGKQKYCMGCRGPAREEWRKAHEAARPPRDPATTAASRKRWLENNRERRLAHVRAYNERNRETINAKSRLHLAKPEVKANRREIDKKYRAQPKQRLDQRMKTALGHALRGTKNGRSWESLVGYSVTDLMKHIERQFVDGMSWDNIGEWHVDHIVAKVHFNYTTAEDREFRAAWALTNLRPLWGVDNLKKNAKRTHLI